MGVLLLMPALLVPVVMTVTVATMLVSGLAPIASVTRSGGDLANSGHEPGEAWPAQCAEQESTRTSRREHASETIEGSDIHASHSWVETYRSIACPAATADFSTRISADECHA